MAKRGCKGAYVRIELPDKQFTLPANTIELLKEASEFAVLRAQSIWKLSKRDALDRNIYTRIRDDTFQEDRDRFHEISEENTGLFHLLLSVFFTKIREEMVPRGATHKTRIQNSYLVAAMSQRELTRACLCLEEDDVKTIPQIDATALGIDQHVWETGFSGALSVARVISAFKQYDTEIFFPIAYIDIQWRIDLLVRFPTSGRGLCLQIKTHHNHNNIRYRVIPEVAPDRMGELSSDDQSFLNGVSEFRNDNFGVWLPLEIGIGSLTYHDLKYVRPTTSIIRAFDRMLEDLAHHV